MSFSKIIVIGSHEGHVAWLAMVLGPMMVSGMVFILWSGT